MTVCLERSVNMEQSSLIFNDSILLSNFFIYAHALTFCFMFLGVKILNYSRTFTRSNTSTFYWKSRNLADLKPIFNELLYSMLLQRMSDLLTILIVITKINRKLRHPKQVTTVKDRSDQNIYTIFDKTKIYTLEVSKAIRIHIVFGYKVQNNIYLSRRKLWMKFCFLD